MKRKAIKNMILLILTSSTIFSMNMESVQAVWKQDSQNKWSWIENGVKATGWKLINGRWYYFFSNGNMTTGWLKDGSRWYYLSESGAMVTGWIKDSDGRWYHLSSSGAMNTGWLKDSNGKWYYLSQSGAMMTGWLEVDGKKYYLETSGEMVTGKISIEGKECSFADSGELITTDSSINLPALDKEETTPDKDENSTPEEKMTGYVVTESSPLNMRKDASAGSSIVTSIPKNSEITVIGKEINGFYKIEYNNKTGYASSAWISFTKPVIILPSGSGENTNVTLGPIRTTGPESGNKYYYSDDNIFYKVKLSPPFNNSSGKPIIGNCTWYAYGRIWEMTGHIPYDAGFINNAYEWWDANIRTGKYKYGQTPKRGALAVWKSSLPNSGGSGHVAVIEKIENNKIYISESSWHGSYYNYREIYNTNHLYGYIYIDEPNF
ncbi:CHAP domain-containing protein [uncultured Clostridium sp.]|uniref:CHAP domain-containing protein n=1 Tax=uncultured Clostridium sp. TaxID=59620 RepID=UPI0025FAC1ED|nr:CHAP domain-containing protein [uncultured Clostridium sp.]